MPAHRQPRVGVLYGGISAEREVSLRSGAAVGRVLAGMGYPVELLDVRDVPISRWGLEFIDAAFIALHGTFGEDGGIQSILEVLGVPYTGSGVRASRLAMDKVASKVAFCEAGVPTAAFVEVEAAWPESRKLEAAASLGLPAVVKPVCQGSSVGLTLARSVSQLRAAVALALEFDDRAIVEEFIPGRELTVGILDDVALPIIELRFPGEMFTYEIKYTKDAATHEIDPELPPGAAEQVRAAALAAHCCLGCRGCTRVDLRLSEDGRPIVLEINTIPGMTDTSLLPDAARATGMSFGQLCEFAVDMALKIGPRGVSARHAHPELLSATEHPNRERQE